MCSCASTCLGHVVIVSHLLSPELLVAMAMAIWVACCRLFRANLRGGDSGLFSRRRYGFSKQAKQEKVGSAAGVGSEREPRLTP